MSDKSVLLKVLTVSKNEKNMNISLIRENMKVFKAALKFSTLYGALWTVLHRFF